MNIRKAQHINADRAIEWSKAGKEQWTGGDWGNALAGECGEACNIIKKIRRVECGLVPYDAERMLHLRADLAEELADTLLYLMLVATHYDLDLEECLRYKFNKVSEEKGFSHRL